MRPSWAIWLIIVLLVTASGIGSVTAVPADTVASQADQPDPDTDRLGWENGYWYDDPINVDNADGLNESELEAVVSRAMARVELIRRLEFKRSVPVEVISHEELRDRRAELINESVPEADRLHQNVKYEAVFFIGENEDAIDTLQSEFVSGAVAQYNLQTDQILIGSANTQSPQMDEFTLAHELVHAAQDQHNLTPSFANRSTEDSYNAVLGITEGDAQYVTYLYRQQCAEAWTCVRPTNTAGGGGDRHIGIALLRLVPYSDGATFVEHFNRDDWERVNDIYENPPVSTEQLIHPRKYLADVPSEFTVADRSSGRWSVLELNASHNYATFGEAGLFLMLWYPSYASGRTQIVPIDIFNQPSPDLYRYNHPYTAGWDGDRLIPYVTSTSDRTNETGYIWETVWDSTGDAREFRNAYEQLLRYQDARQYGPRTWIIDDGEFADAFYLTQTGRQVLIVNGPTIGDLREIHPDIRIETPTTTEPSTTITATTTDPQRTEPPPTIEEPDRDTPRRPTPATTTAPRSPSAGQPGFDLGLAILVISLSMLLWRRRH